MSDNCIFCKIANGEIPSRTMYENERFRVILDLSPATKGHVLIIPKVHYQDLFELPEEYASEVFVLAKNISARLKEKLKCDGLNIVQNNGKVAGQTVFHFHLHIIPRYIDDQQVIGWQPTEPNVEVLDELLSEIKE